MVFRQFDVSRLGEVGFIVGQVRLENQPFLASVVGRANYSFFNFFFGS
jgi:hypothetical protein